MSFFKNVQLRKNFYIFENLSINCFSKGVPRPTQGVKMVTTQPCSEYSTEAKAHAQPEEVSVEKMKSKEFEGWKVFFNRERCGYIKFKPKVDEIFLKHVTVDMKISQNQRSRHIGRIALKKAIDASSYDYFVAYLRKSNIASKKALSWAGFKEHEHPTNQLCMVYRKI